MDDVRSTPGLWIILDPLIQLIVFISAKESADCEYECKGHGGCTVTYTGALRISQVRSISGWFVTFFSCSHKSQNFQILILHSSQSILQGSCFPASFGGHCSGTPSFCKDCNKVLTDCWGEGGMRPNFDWTNHIYPPKNLKKKKLITPWHCKMWNCQLFRWWRQIPAS